MQDHPVLGHVALGYCPMIDRQRAVVATRLTVFPERPDASPDAAALLRALEEVWPAPEAASVGSAPLTLELRPLSAAAPAARPAGVRPAVLLNVAGEAMLRAIMAASPGPHVMLEVPAFMAADPAHAAILRELQAAGTPLIIKGRPAAPLAAELQARFGHVLVESGDDRRSAATAAGGARQLSVQDGVRTTTELDLAFQRGVVAVLGWPFDDPLPAATSRRSVPTDIQVVMELVAAVDREEPVGKLEAILKRDPTLAFRLMRYLNSAAFGLSVEINSFGHALMLLGYVRLKRWLALLLASSSKDANAKPLLFAAVRRGLLLEELVRSQGDAELRSEIFICGVFSLLDRLLRQPFSELLANVPVPARVLQALRHEDGPFHPYLELVRAIEASAVFDIRECSERLLLGPAEVNRALLTALRAARQLD